MVNPKKNQLFNQLKHLYVEIRIIYFNQPSKLNKIGIIFGAEATLILDTKNSDQRQPLLL